MQLRASHVCAGDSYAQEPLMLCEKGHDLAKYRSLQRLPVHRCLCSRVWLRYKWSSSRERRVSLLYLFKNSVPIEIRAHTHARTHTHTHTYTVRQCEPPGPSGPELPYTSREEVANTKSREIALAGQSKLLCIFTPCGTVVGTLRRLEMWLPPHPRWGIPWGPGQTSRGPARVDVRTFVSSIAISQGMNGILVGTRCL